MLIGGSAITFNVTSLYKGGVRGALKRWEFRLVTHILIVQLAMDENVV